MHRISRSVKFCSALRRFGTKASPGSETSAPPVKSPLEGIPLTQPLPGFPKPVYVSVNEKDQRETKVTKLSNGIRVASQAKYGQFCTVGLVVDAGSRYEVAYPNGISHFLEKLAFQATKEFESRDAIMQYLEKYGGICDCQISRDSTVYASSAEILGMDAVVRLLNDVSRRMLIKDEELLQVRQAVRFDLDDLASRYEQEPLLTEMIHSAAFRENTVGLPRLCPAENIEKIDRQTLFSYLSQFFAPSRFVVAGVGVDHDALVESTERYFLNTKATWEEDASLLLLEKNKEEKKTEKTEKKNENEKNEEKNVEKNPDNSVAQYTGGDVRIEKDLSTASLGSSTIPELSHFVLGFESCSHSDDDFIPFCVLNILMGGGSSFSAGGPGKGMYSRLYMNALNVHHWLFSCTSFNHTYADAGLFCIHASCPPEHTRQMVQLVIKMFHQMVGEVDEVELNRAKTQLSSMLMMNLESRPVIFEDIGRQVLAYGFRKSAKTLLEEIGRVSPKDLRRVAGRMLRTKAAVACLGRLDEFPSYSEIEKNFALNSPAKKQKLAFFS